MFKRKKNRAVDLENLLERIIFLERRREGLLRNSERLEEEKTKLLERLVDEELVKSQQLAIARTIAGKDKQIEMIHGRIDRISKQINYIEAAKEKIEAEKDIAVQIEMMKKISEKTEEIEIETRVSMDVLDQGSGALDAMVEEQEVEPEIQEILNLARKKKSSLDDSGQNIDFEKIKEEDNEDN